MKELVRISELNVKYNQDFLPRLVTERAWTIDKDDLYDTEGIDIRNVPLILEYIYDIKHLMEENAFVFAYGNDSLIGFYHVSKGTSNSSQVDTDAIMRFLIFSGANSFIFVHNHPNGNCILSKNDYELTQDLIMNEELTGIKLLEHIIIGKHDWSENLILVKSMDKYDYRTVYEEQSEYFSHRKRNDDSDNLDDSDDVFDDPDDFDEE